MSMLPKNEDAGNAGVIPHPFTLQLLIHECAYKYLAYLLERSLLLAYYFAWSTALHQVFTGCGFLDGIPR